MDEDVGREAKNYEVESRGGEVKDAYVINDVHQGGAVGSATINALLALCSTNKDLRNRDRLIHYPLSVTSVSRASSVMRTLAMPWKARIPGPSAVR